MQDRFKFRSYGRPNSIIEGMQNIYTFEESKDGYFNVKVDKGWLSFVKEEDLKIMQCTGLKDKNGKLIYEGDIISVKIKTQDAFNVEEYYSENYKGEIIFKEGEFAIRVIDTKKQPISLYYYANGCEIIGNIYENSELLEEINN